MERGSKSSEVNAVRPERAGVQPISLLGDMDDDDDDDGGVDNNNDNGNNEAHKLPSISFSCIVDC